MTGYGAKVRFLCTTVVRDWSMPHLLKSAPGTMTLTQQRHLGELMARVTDRLTAGASGRYRRMACTCRLFLCQSRRSAGILLSVFRRTAFCRGCPSQAPFSAQSPVKSDCRRCSLSCLLARVRTSIAQVATSRDLARIVAAMRGELRFQSRNAKPTGNGLNLRLPVP